jgi:small subunit ribosomal protein S19
MARSIRKGPYIEPQLMKKVEEANQNKSRKVIKTWSRRSTVLPDMIATFAVHNGKNSSPSYSPKHGRASWEFSPTRAFFSHSTTKDKLKPVPKPA